MMNRTRTNSTGKRRMRKWPKVMIHEHLDCSLRPRTMMELWEAIGFEAAKIPFPEDVLSPWKKADSVSGNERRALRSQAVSAYQQFLVRFASQSLANYVQAIVDHILPVMQTPENLARITRERIEDAVTDGVVAMELRFAPQLHTWTGLTLEEVMNAVVAEVKKSPFPLKLIVCALRHENGDMARKLADLAIKYRRYVGVFDLAADEKANPGILRWWLVAALYVCAQVPEMRTTVHLWETDEPTDEDIRLLNSFDFMLAELMKRLALRGNLPADDIWAAAAAVVDELFLMKFAGNEADEGRLRIGHGFRGRRQGQRVLEICPTSNVVTGQVSSFEKHPINDLHRAGKLVTVNTDGTLFTQVQLTDEYAKIIETFGWNRSDFLTVNLTALEASSFSNRVKQRLRAQLRKAYGAC